MCHVAFVAWKLSFGDNDLESLAWDLEFGVWIPQVRGAVRQVMWGGASGRLIATRL